MSAATQPRPALSNFKEAEQVAENGTVSKHHSMAQRQMVRVLAFTSQSAWTPEAISGIVFGILMFLLGVIAVLQTRHQKLIVIGGISPCLALIAPQWMNVSADWGLDIESNIRLPVMHCTHIIEADPNLWVPPYEPPQGFVCIADPPDSYPGAHGRVLAGQEPKKPAPKPKPVTKPPQPRDGFEVDIDLANATPDTKDRHAWSFGGQESKTPAPKPKPKPKPKPPPPKHRDGYETTNKMADATPDTINQHPWNFGGQGPKKPAPKPKPNPKPVPPQPRDGYATSSTRIFLIPQDQGKAFLILGVQGVV